ncbi:MAG: multicopper oxidase domain-containing protein [Thiohalomonadales bacterium]
MDRTNKSITSITVLLLFAGLPFTASAAPYVQCPADALPFGDGNGRIDASEVAAFDADAANPLSPNFGRNVKCMHISAGDGFVKMADDAAKLQYVFSFSDLTTTSTAATSILDGTLAANVPAPSIILEQDQEFYLTLTNVGMANRPDLSDPHTVHFHGFPQASAIFDGVPDATISVNMGASLTYYYNVVEPGTYMYHCHVEATEHMQMGMLGNLYVHAGQDKVAVGTPLGSYFHTAGDRYAYNDGDGSTVYQVEAAIQLASFDPVFHDASMNTQPLPFAGMKDTYAMLNGRGYPDTVNPGALVPPPETGGKVTQKVSAFVEANVGQKILLRLSNLNVTNYYTLTALGLDMRVVGKGARQLKGSDGIDLSYYTKSVTLGGGEAWDVIIDTTGVAPGTYFLYTTNMNFLSNNTEDYGGMMTEIFISPPSAPSPVI